MHRLYTWTLKSEDNCITTHCQLAEVSSTYWIVPFYMKKKIRHLKWEYDDSIVIFLAIFLNKNWTRKVTFTGIKLWTKFEDEINEVLCNLFKYIKYSNQFVVLLCIILVLRKVWRYDSNSHKRLIYKS